MPRVSIVSKEEAIQTVENFIDHFRTTQLPNFSSKVWTQMSEALGSKWSPHNVYIAVREDRRGILSIARERKGITVPTDNTQKRSTIIDRSGRRDPDFEIYDNPQYLSLKSSFPLTLDARTWERIKPEERLKKKQKSREGLVPYKWTHIIFDAFFERYRFPCAYIFKNAHIYSSPSSKYYMVIKGVCKSRKCSNPFFGIVENKPEMGKGLTINVKTRDTSLDNHEKVQRPLRGFKSKAVHHKDVIEGVSDYLKRTTRDNIGVEEEHVDLHTGIIQEDEDNVIITISDIDGTPMYTGSFLGIEDDSFYLLDMRTPNPSIQYCHLEK